MAGIQRNAADQQKLDDAFTRIRAKYKLGLPPVGTISIPDGADPLYSEIDLNIHKRLDLASIQEAVGGFRYQQADILIDQAADLLERAARSRSDYDGLRTAGFKTGLDVLAFNLLDNIHMQEAAAGVYNLDDQESAADADAYKNVTLHAYSAHQYLAMYFAQLTAKRNQIALRAGRAARLQTQPVSTDDIPAAAKIATYTYDGEGPKPKQDWADEFGAESENNNLDLTLANLGADMESSLAAALNTDIRQAVKADRATFDHLAGGDTGFLVNRTLVGRSVNEMKVMEMSNEGGALNYAERMISVQAHFDSDVGAALSRIMAASDGLQMLFGYDNALPAAVALIKARAAVPDDPSRRFVDDCLAWIREAIDFVVRFRQLDQSYIVPVSLRSLLGVSAGQPLPIAAGPLQFVLNETLFRDVANMLDERHVRLRGISAFVIENNDPPGLWELLATIPRQSFCRLHPSLVPAGGNEVVQLDQSDVPPCRIATVERRSSQRAPIVAGAAALFNASPFSAPGSSWSVLVRPIPGSAAVAGNLSDVFIELHVATRSAL
jgi:hypothetical protein